VAADIQDHRPMPSHERGEGRLTGGIARPGKPLDELAVGQSGNGQAIE
jgi:hypothetical protein